MKYIILAEQNWAATKKDLKAMPTIAAATKVAEVIWKSRN